MRDARLTYNKQVINGKKETLFSCMRKTMEFNYSRNPEPQLPAS